MKQKYKVATFIANIDECHISPEKKQITAQFIYVHPSGYRFIRSARNHTRPTMSGDNITPYYHSQALTSFHVADRDEKNVCLIQACI